MKIINDGNFPEPFMNAVKYDDYDFSPSEDHISVTQLIDSPLIRKLKLKHGDTLEQNASDMVWSLRGKAMHYVLENSGSSCIKELRLEHTVNINNKLITISVKLDVYEVNTRILWEYKD